MSEDLPFQQAFNKAHDFKLVAFIGCMCDVIYDADQGLILVFAKANRIQSRDKRYTFDKRVELCGDVARYAIKTIDGDEWWDRGSRCFKVILEYSRGGRLMRQAGR